MKSFRLVVLICLCAPFSIAVASDLVGSGDKIKRGIPLAAFLHTFIEARIQLPVFFGSKKEGSGGESRLMLAKTILFSAAITEGLKDTVNKQRPDGNCCRSFPSAHTSSAFSAAAFLQKRYGWWYGIPAYSLASYVGYSRIETKKHYPVDVVAGALIGITSAFIFTSPNPHFHIQPEVRDESIGIGIEIKW